MPRWLSSAKMEVVRSLLADDPAMLLRESMGIGADGSTKAFPSRDIEAFIKRTRAQIYIDMSDAALNLKGSTNHVIVAVDPAGGGSSAFAVTSIVQLPNGTIVVRRRPVAQTLAGPHLIEHQRKQHHRIGGLAAVPEEQRHQERQHPLHQVLCERGVLSAARNLPLLLHKELAHLLLPRERKQQRRPFAARGVARVLPMYQRVELLHCLLARLRLAVDLRQQPQHGLQMRVQAARRRIRVARSLRERRPHQQRAQPDSSLHVAQVLGAEALRTKDVRATHRLIINHIARVRKIKGLERSTIVFQLESNLAFESQHILHSLNENGVKKWVALSEGQGGTIGWLTTNERKESMCFQLRDALRVGCITLHEDFFSVSMEPRAVLKILEDELRAFAIVTEAAKTTFGKIRKTYTGKLGGRNDDMAICLQLAITGTRCFYASEKYAQFRPEF